MPSAHLVSDRVGDGRDQRGRDLNAPHLLQVGGHLTGAHAGCIERQDALVKAGYTALVLGQELGGEAGIAVAGNGDFDLAEVATDGFGGMA